MYDVKLWEGNIATQNKLCYANGHCYWLDMVYITTEGGRNTEV